MRKIKSEERIVKNIYEDNFVKWEATNSGRGESIIQLDNSKPLGVGFHIYKVSPGGFSSPHEHTGHEQFLLIEGDLVDNDGTIYIPGDFVLLKKGTQHNSFTKDGCLLAVFIEKPEKLIKVKN